MLRSSKPLYGLPLPLPRLRMVWTGLVSLVLILLLAGCGGGPLSLLTGGGPNVLANTQVGKENTQTIGNSTQQKFGENKIVVVSAPPTEGVDVSLRPPTKVPDIKQVQNETNYELPTWVYILFILLFIVGWTTDTPGTILKNFKGKK